MNLKSDNNIELLTQKLKNPDAVIFDMDGVLVDSEVHHVKIENSLFERFKIPVSDEEHRGYMGTATHEMWATVKQNYKMDFVVDEMIKLNNLECKNHFSTVENLEPMPGLTDLLELLNEKNIPMAVASSSELEIIEIILFRIGIKKYFRTLVSGSMVERSKPEPDIFLRAVQILKVDPKNCWVIEDSFNGVKAAKTAGMFCVAYSGASTGQEQAAADIQINHFSELEHLLVQIL